MTPVLVRISRDPRDRFVFVAAFGWHADDGFRSTSVPIGRRHERGPLVPRTRAEIRAELRDAVRVGAARLSGRYERAERTGRAGYVL